MDVSSLQEIQQLVGRSENAEISADAQLAGDTAFSYKASPDRSAALVYASSQSGRDGARLEEPRCVSLAAIVSGRDQKSDRRVLRFFGSKVFQVWRKYTDGREEPSLDAMNVETRPLLAVAFFLPPDELQERERYVRAVAGVLAYISMAHLINGVAA